MKEAVLRRVGMPSNSGSADIVHILLTCEAKAKPPIRLMSCL